MRTLFVLGLSACDRGSTGDLDADRDVDADTDTSAACLSETTTTALARHVDDLGQSGALLLGHAGPREAVSAFLFPGYTGLVAQYATLLQACTAPALFEEWCEGGLCWQLECTGEGAGHVTHGRLESPPLRVNGFVLEAATADTAWFEATGEVILTMASTESSPEGVDLSMTGTSTLLPEGTVVIEEAFPGLVEGGAVLSATLDLAATSISGQLVGGSGVMAEWDGHDLLVTGDCP
jgi:hypothetical protein